MTPLSTSLPRFCARCRSEIEGTIIWKPDGSAPYHPACYNLEMQGGCQSCASLKTEIARLASALAEQREADAKLAENFLTFGVEAQLIARAIRNGGAQ